MLLRQKGFSGVGNAVTSQVRSSGTRKDRVSDQSPQKCASGVVMAVRGHVPSVDKRK